MPAISTILCAGIICGQTTPPPKIVDPPAVEAKKPAPFKLSDLVGLKGQTAPQFILSAMNGTQYNLENLRGKIVVINLWGTFCAPCVEEMPKLNALVEKYKGKEVVFLAPAPDGKSDLEVFLQKHAFNYQVLPNGFAVVEKYAPHKKSDDSQKKGGFMMILPTHLVINQIGVVTYHDWGFSKDTAAELSKEIERLLAKETAQNKPD